MKNNISRIILGVLFPIAYIVLFLVIDGTEHGATCWIGLGFTLFSYITMICAPLLVPGSKSMHLFGVTNASLTSVYFVISFVIGLIFMISDFEQWKYAVVIEVILLVVFLVLFIPVLISDEETAMKENKREKEVCAVKLLVTKTKMIVDKTSDLQNKKIIMRLYDELNSCQTTSNDAVKSIDLSIDAGIKRLEIAVDSNNSDDIKKLVEELIILTKERKNISL